MFISPRYKFVFLEVPRTGSHSVTNALTQLDPESPTALERRKQGWFYKYHDVQVPWELKDTYCIFAAHRNPYSRLWSYWKHRNATGNPEVFKTLSWERYVAWACDPHAVPEIQSAMPDVPVSELVECEGVDFWLRFETLDQSWIELGEHLDLNLPRLKMANASQPRIDYRDAYNADLAGKVFERFREDFQQFHYAENSWRRTT